MPSIGKIIADITHPKLFKLAQESEKKLKCLKEENVFRSKTLHELFSDKFEYKGSEPDTIYIKHIKTGEPVEAKIKTEVTASENRRFFKEIYTITDKQGKIIGDKFFICEKCRDGKYKMAPGNMNNYSQEYGGVGIRLDQMQIERALELGFTSVPRLSMPKASVYHLKMGFLPYEIKLVPINSIKQVRNLTEDEFIGYAIDIALVNFVPLIVRKGTKFYIDVNKTQALTNIEECKKRLEKTNAYRLTKLKSNYAMLKLSGEELEHWKELIKGHQILPKLSERNYY